MKELVMNGYDAIREWSYRLPAVLSSSPCCGGRSRCPLVKYPTDLDITPRYRGTLTLFVDPATAKPLAAPASLPLDIDRHIHVFGDQSGSSRVVVEETITQKAGDLLNTTQTNVYVMDRRTMKNVADDRAYAFTPSNVVDRRAHID